MIGTTAALLIGAGISAGTQAYAAHKASGAAKDAAKTQVEASDKALDLQRDMYNQNRADQEPYRNVGSQAITTLGSLMGLPSGPVGGTSKAMTLGGLTEGPGHFGTDGRYVPPMAPTVGQAMPRPGAQNPYAGLPPHPDFVTDPARARTASSFATGQAGQRMVTVQAPDGETRQVPEHMAERIVAAGGKLVS